MARELSNDPVINRQGGSRKMVLGWINERAVLLFLVTGSWLVFDFHKWLWFGTVCG